MRGDSRQLLLTLLPGVGVITVFLVLPSIYLVGMAFLSTGPYGLPTGPVSLQAFRELAGFGFLGWSPGNLYTLLRSIGQTLLATILVILIAYPAAYYITTRPVPWRPVLLLAVVVPSWTNQVIRSVGWMNIRPRYPGIRPGRSAGADCPGDGAFPVALCGHCGACLQLSAVHDSAALCGVRAP